MSGKQGAVTTIRGGLIAAGGQHQLIAIALLQKFDLAVGMVAVRGRLGEASVSSADLLEAALRMRPDRIIMGENRGVEALSYLRAVNTGHPGSISTIHASSPSGAIEQLALIVGQSGSDLRRSETVAYIRSTIDLIVQLGRGDGQRNVTAIQFPLGTNEPSQLSPV